MDSRSLVRYAVAFVFITSGFMKLFDEDLQGFFIQLGLPSPVLFMYVVAVVEIICGLFILLDRSVRTAVIPLILIMVGAIILTKVPHLHKGFIPFAFQARLDIVMLVLLISLYKD